MFNYFKKRFSRRSKQKSINGFTLAELLVASAISAVVLSIAYSLVNVILTSNKNDNTNIALSTKIENALDFVVDEVKSSKNVISSWNDIPSRCVPQNKGEFVLGLTLPDQALTNDSYKNKTNVNWKKVDCPIVYTLQQDTSYKGRGASYKLFRDGPQLDQKGFYIPTKLSQTLISDRIKYQPDDVMPCDTARGWSQRKVKGIIICTAPFNKAAEIGISAETVLQSNKYSTITKSSGGYAKIQDENLIGDIGTSFFNLGNNKQPCSTPPCCVFGRCSNTLEQTFYIDVSGSMRSCRAKGKNCLEAAKEEVMRVIAKLNEGVMLQVVKFNGSSTFLWPGGSKPVNPQTRSQAINFVRNLQPGGWTNPWNGLMRSIKDQNVSQIILISDGYADSRGVCNGRSQKYADCFEQINNQREGMGWDPVKVDSISIGLDFCRTGGWMGEISNKTNGKCDVIR